ncbi:MAG: MoaD/ThiS family protein [Acidimicrobiales bacterium]
MSVDVRISTQMRLLTGGAADVTVEAGTVREAIGALERDYPGMQARLLDGEGKLRRYVSLFVGDEDIRFLGGLDTELPDGSRLSIIPALAGG